METIKNIRNDLFKRKEISFMLESDKNPGFEGTRKIIADDFKIDEEAIDVYGVKGSFGSSKFKVDAYVYDSREDLKKAKQLTQKQRAEMKKTAEDAKKAEGEKAEDSDKKEPTSEVKSEV